MQGAQHHFGMFRKVAVDGDTVLRIGKMHPIRFNVNSPIPLLEKQNIRGNFRSRVGLEGVVGQTNRAKQFITLRKVLAHLWASLVHRTFRGDECDHAAGAYLVDSFGEEIIVDVEIQLVIGFVRHFVIAKRGRCRWQDRRNPGGRWFQSPPR